MPHTPEEQRLLALMAELTSRRGYATGAERFPRPLDRADVLAISADVQAAVDVGTEARAEVIAASGTKLACHAGCAACCDQLVAVFADEAALIADWLNAPEHADSKAAFLAAYPSWRERTGDRLARLAAARDADEHREILLEQWRARVTCAFNHEGLCSIYPVRPVPCRTAHAVNTPDLCHPGGGKEQPARMLHFVPLEDLVKKTRDLQLAMHHALGGARMQPEALCVAVHELLRA